MIGLTLTAYLLLYSFLLLAYIFVVKGLSEKPNRGQTPKLPGAVERKIDAAVAQAGD